MTSFQATAKDRDGNPVKIGPAVRVRQAAVNAALAHRVDAEIVADGAVIVTTVKFVPSDSAHPETSRLVPLIEQLVPEAGDAIVGYSAPRIGSSRKRGKSVKW